MPVDELHTIRFRGALRPSQLDAVQIARRRLDEGHRRLHIVAPPGSGKTVLGLFLWAECLRCPALVLSPNSAIQAQWASRTSLFEFEGDRNALISTDPENPKLLTSLTYQSITLPRRGDTDLDSLAEELWIERLVAKNQATDPQEAAVWIADLKRHNPDYYTERLGGYRKQVRDRRSVGGEALDMLHRSSLATLERLRAQNVGLIILDECHHLMGHWGRVLADAREFLEQPVIVGLTATPPDRSGKTPDDVARYDEFFGPIDYEVPVPAVVKDGFLAPYQDLAYFVRPAADELAFIASADEQLHQLVATLCDPKTFEQARDGESDEESLSEPNDEPTLNTREGEGAPPFRWSAEPEFARDGEAPAKPEFPLNSETTVPNQTQAQRAARLSSPKSSEGTPEYPLNADNATTENSRGIEPEPTVANRETLPDWVLRVLTERRLPAGVMKDWKSFERRDPEFATAARLFLLNRGVKLPADVLPPQTEVKLDDVPEMAVLVPVLDRYIRHRLRRSRVPCDHALAVRAINRLRTLGVQITETGSQPCASPVGRVMAYSRSKTAALLPILKTEIASLGNAIRAVVVADYEKTSAVSAEVSHLLDSEAGGAIAAFKSLLNDPVTDALDPVLVTGSSVLVDDDAWDKLVGVAKNWLEREGYAVELSASEEEGFHVLIGKGADWCPRVYVSMITDLFQQGVTRCLVGTRGLLGEGWDASKINVLVDLTTVTTTMSVNQLRGRSIRLDTDEPEKLANNWDVVCVAPEFTKGFDDYQRFILKHETIFGITDDGTIEKGVGHVHPAFTELKPEGIEQSVQALNAEMLDRAGRRPQVRVQWRIGQPFAGRPIRAIEIRPLPSEESGGFPPFDGSPSPWTSRSLTQAIGEAVLGALQEVGLIATSADVHAGNRAGGYVRAFLENATEKDGQLFAEAMRDAFGPLVNPRYVIPRKVDNLHETLLSRMLPRIVGRYFRRRKRAVVMLHAVPTALARKKHLVRIYERYWNAHVSPGKAVYVHRGEGETLIETARKRGLVPRAAVHEKDVFV